MPLCLLVPFFFNCSKCAVFYISKGSLCEPLFPTHCRDFEWEAVEPAFLAQPLKHLPMLVLKLLYFVLRLILMHFFKQKAEIHNQPQLLFQISISSWSDVVVSIWMGYPHFMLPNIMGKFVCWKVNWHLVIVCSKHECILWKMFLRLPWTLPEQCRVGRDNQANMIWTALSLFDNCFFKSPSWDTLEEMTLAFTHWCQTKKK